MIFILHFTCAKRNKILLLCKTVRISQKDFKTYEQIMKFIDKNDLSERDLRKYINCKINLEISSEDGTYKSLSNISTCIGVPRQTLDYAHKHKKPLITGRKKAELKSSTSSSWTINNLNFIAATDLPNKAITLKNEAERTKRVHESQDNFVQISRILDAIVAEF